MRILFIINRILLFISFFLPFFLIPQCGGPSEEEKAAAEAMIQDSIHISDSINQINQYVTTNTTFAISNPDSINVYSNLTEPKDTTVNEKASNNIFEKFHTFLISPTEKSMSGYGMVFLQISQFEFYWQEIIVSCFSLSFLLSFVGIFLLLVKQRPILQNICSLICLSTFIIFLLYIFAFEHVLTEDTLWGLWTCLILNLTNVIITIIISKKTSEVNSISNGSVK